MKTLITDYAIDGIIWDEPKASTLISHHPDTIKRFGSSPTAQDMAHGYCEFFSELTEYCHHLRSDLTQTLFCIKHEEAYFTAEIAQTKYLDYFGYDGNLCKQRYFKEEIKDSNRWLHEQQPHRIPEPSIHCAW